MNRSPQTVLRVFFLFAVVALGSAFLVGCTSQAPAPTATVAATAVISATPTLSATATPTVMAENKTGTDKVQETIQAALADGNYTQNVTYEYHKGTVDVNFLIEIADGKIAQVAATPLNADPISTGIVGKFNGGIQELTDGKKISELDIPKNVAGSSLTTAAFKAYVSSLASQ